MYTQLMQYVSVEESSAHYSNNNLNKIIYLDRWVLTGGFYQTPSTHCLLIHLLQVVRNASVGQDLVM